MDYFRKPVGRKLQSLKFRKLLIKSTNKTKMGEINRMLWLQTIKHSHPREIKNNLHAQGIRIYRSIFDIRLLICL